MMSFSESEWYFADVTVNSVTVCVQRRSHAGLFPARKASRGITFNGRNGNNADVIVLHRRLNYWSTGINIIPPEYFYKKLSNAYCAWHCHRKWRIILRTPWKKQAQENPNRFNSICVSLSFSRCFYLFIFCLFWDGNLLLPPPLFKRRDFYGKT